MKKKKKVFFKQVVNPCFILMVTFILCVFYLMLHDFLWVICPLQRDYWGGSVCSRCNKPLTPAKDPGKPSQELELTERKWFKAIIRSALNLNCNKSALILISIMFDGPCPLVMHLVKTVTHGCQCQNRKKKHNAWSTCCTQ